jgi:hypothetical protein
MVTQGLFRVSVEETENSSRLASVRKKDPPKLTQHTFTQHMRYEVTASEASAEILMNK